MRWSRRTCAVSSLLGSTLVYAIPSPIDDRSGKRMFVERAPLDDDISMVTGFAAPATVEAAAAPSQTQNNNSGNGGGNANNPSTPADNAAVPNPSPTAHDTLTDASNELNDITMSSGYASELGQSGGGSILANQSESNVVTFSSSSSSAQNSSLAPAPASSSGPNHGVLIGIVVGGVLLGVVTLTVGLWLCYRRRGPTSGASTPRYDTATAGDEKEKPSFLAFLRSGLTRGSGGKRNTKWKRGHLRVKSSQSFASPMIANDPKLMEEVARTRTRTLSMKNPPALPPHLATTGVSGGVGTSGTVTGKDRWSTFSSSDGGSVQTPVAATRLDGIIMETVRETDGPSNPQTPIFGQRQSQYQTQTHQSSIDYLDLKRTPSDGRSPFDSATQIPPLTLGSRMSKASGSFYRDEMDLSSPTTPTSSGGLTYGSNGSYGSIGRPRRTSDRYTYSQPLLTTSAMTPNVSYPTISTQHQASSTPALPLFSGANASALVAARPKFNPTHTNKSGVSVGGNSGGSAGSGNSANETIRITNPFLGGDEDDLSSYGHGIIEADDLDHLDHLDMIKGDEDAMSINSADTGILAYPSSTGCLPNKPSPSPNLFANPLRSVNPALIEADAAAKAAHANAHARTAAQRISSSSTQTPSYSSNSSNTYTHPRSSMISDSSSDYPYPLGYAIDHEGNVANPFLRISEILEEVDGRMRWPSPPLLPRSESPNY